MEWFYNLIVCFKVETNLSTVKASNECDRVEWIPLEKIATIPLFEGEESLRAIFAEELNKNT